MIPSFLRRCRLSYAEIELAGLDPPLVATEEHLQGCLQYRVSIKVY
jgi:hypothetical protein